MASLVGENVAGGRQDGMKPWLVGSSGGLEDRNRSELLSVYEVGSSSWWLGSMCLAWVVGR